MMTQAEQKLNIYFKIFKNITKKNLVRKDINIVMKGVTKPGVVIRNQCILAGLDKHFQKIRSIAWLFEKEQLHD